MCASVKLVDQGHPACSVMAEEVCGRPLMEPLHAFLDSLLSLYRCFLS